MTNLSEEQRANLGKLAAYLEGLPADYEYFEMGTWFGRDAAQPAPFGVERHYALRNGGLPACGAVACAVGHGPAAGVLVPEDFIEDGLSQFVDWRNYAAHSFGTFGHSWCFAAEWAEVDNTHSGAAARIRYLLSNDAAPDGWDFDADTVSLYAPAKQPSNV